MASSASESQVTSVQRTVETQVLNPLLSRVLQSPAHRLASRWTMLVSYIGPESRRRYTFPVVYAEVDAGLVTVTPRDESNWWRNFRTPMDCYVWYRGEPCPATGEVVSGDASTDLLAEYALAHALLARQFGISANRFERRENDQTDLAVVRFSLD